LHSFISLIATSCLLFVHNYHVSKTEVHYKSDIDALQLTVNVFIDDLELALETFGDHEYRLFSDSEYESADSLIALYFDQHIKINLDGSPQKVNYLGKEISDDLMAAWCYLEIQGVQEFGNIEIDNTVLLKEFDDQKNIINFKVDRKSKAFHILDQKEHNKLISLE